LYLPSVGFCWLAAALLDRTPRWIAFAPVTAVLGGLLASWYAITTVNRNYDWHDNITLYEKTLIVSPEATLIAGNLANAYFLGDSVDRALPLFRRIARDKPLDPLYQVYLGTALARMGRFQEARLAYERARALRPDLVELWTNLGLLSEMEGKKDEAEKEYRTALKLDPQNGDAHQNLGALLVGQGKFEEAQVHFQASASLGSLGQLLATLGRLHEAEDTLRSAVKQDVTNAEALYLLGNILRGEGREQEAQVAFHEMRRVLPYTKWRPPAEGVSGMALH
jgi:Flp pilus assembly protein TadD